MNINISNKANVNQFVILVTSQKKIKKFAKNAHHLVLFVKMKENAKFVVKDFILLRKYA